tara:strand:+ start:238 stop:372 length:135 start_codon:yes stop_codon:yes gene_type:complete
MLCLAKKIYEKKFYKQQAASDKQQATSLPQSGDTKVTTKGIKWK